MAGSRGSKHPAECAQHIGSMRAYKVRPAVRDACVKLFDPAFAVRLGERALVALPEARIAERMHVLQRVLQPALPNDWLPRTHILKLDHVHPLLLQRLRHATQNQTVPTLGVDAHQLDALQTTLSHERIDSRHFALNRPSLARACRSNRLIARSTAIPCVNAASVVRHRDAVHFNRRPCERGELLQKLLVGWLELKGVQLHPLRRSALGDTWAMANDAHATALEPARRRGPFHHEAVPADVGDVCVRVALEKLREVIALVGANVEHHGIATG
mmetsp:Transcript_17857/g.39969  ORF Transcript_17857/g.39969 Transcript_17857/m.39969 type:complete len:272 (+) Transcript_17857:590-1405(+)